MDSRYTYAVGYIRALENKLLPGHVFGQLVNSGGLPAFLKILEATPYSAADIDELNASLEEKGQELSTLVKKLMIEDLFKEIAGLPYDYYNLSSLLSAKKINPDITPFLYEGRGNIDPSELKDAVYENKYRRVPGHIAETIDKAESISENFDNPAFIAVAAEREYFHALQLKCEAAGNIFFLDYSAASSDIYNLNTFFRIKRLGAGMDALRTALAAAGTIKPGVFIAWLKTGEDAVPEEISRSPYGRLAEKGEACLRERKPMSVMAAAADGIIFNLLAKAGMVVMGPEPVFAYNIRVEHEMKLLRMIPAGVKSGAEPALISERIYLPS